jgi:hypothetical protein|nr:MAG TPA: hypothetical protein [Bacteriophage sp.]
MSENIFDVLDNASIVYKERLPLSDYDKVRIQRLDNERFFKRDLSALLIARASAYHVMSDEELLAYLKGAVFRFRHLQVLRALACCAADEDGRFERYTREMRWCNQAICRIQRERTRRVIADVDAKLRE